MKNYLIIRNDEVINVIVADSKESAELVYPIYEIIESTDSEPWIGWKRENGTWINPSNIITE
jgi:hypothetical protein